MKKMTLVVVLAAAFMLVAATAMAIGPAYVDWSAGSAANSGTGGPHSNYQLTTEKCAVCHSVHAAASNGAAAGVFGPAAITSEPEMLLRSSVADACTYCHITNWSTSGTGIYAGVATNYTTSSAFAHNASSTSGSAYCTKCHAVHGANTFGGQASEKILRSAAIGNGVPAAGTYLIQSEAVAGMGAAGDIATGTDEDAQVTVFCTRCHKTYSTDSYQNITAYARFSPYSGAAANQTMTYKNHPLKAAGATFGATGATYTGKVAWADSTYCRSCHAAGADDIAIASGGSGGLVISSFPHYTPNKSSFLVAGLGSGDAQIGADSSAAVSGYDVLDAGEDGVCLRCHTNGTAANGNNNSNGTAGVGITF